MYTNFYVYMAYRQYMSGKLYWRIKKDGKWTWRPVIVHSIDTNVEMRTGCAWHLIQEEEE